MGCRFINYEKKFSEENDDFKYLLNVIDTFSKYVWIEPLKDKTGKNYYKIKEETKITSCRYG